MTSIEICMAVDQGATRYFTLAPREQAALRRVLENREAEAQRLMTEVVWPSSGHRTRRPHR
jgi:hypothetical protein